MCKMNNTLDGINSRSGNAEGKTGESEGTVIETIQNEIQTKSEKQKMRVKKRAV